MQGKAWEELGCFDDVRVQRARACTNHDMSGIFSNEDDVLENGDAKVAAKWHHSPDPSTLVIAAGRELINLQISPRHRDLISTTPDFRRMYLN